MLWVCLDPSSNNRWKPGGERSCLSWLLASSQARKCACDACKNFRHSLSRRYSQMCAGWLCRATVSLLSAQKQHYWMVH